MPDPISWYSMSQVNADITAPASTRFIARQDGFLRRVQVMLHGAITVATETITAQIDNGTAFSIGTIPVSGSAEGVQMIPSGGTVAGPKELWVPVKKGSNIEILNDGASTGPQPGTIQVTCSP